MRKTTKIEDKIFHHPYFEILNKKNGDEFCIFENIAAQVFDLGSPLGFYFFDILIFYTKLKFQMGLGKVTILLFH